MLSYHIIYLLTSPCIENTLEKVDYQIFTNYPLHWKHAWTLNESQIHKSRFVPLKLDLCFLVLPQNQKWTCHQLLRAQERLEKSLWTKTSQKLKKRHEYVFSFSLLSFWKFNFISSITHNLCIDRLQNVVFVWNLNCLYILTPSLFPFLFTLFGSWRVGFYLGLGGNLYCHSLIWT